MRRREVGFLMFKGWLTTIILAAMVFFCVNATPAAAQAPRTWVSGVGDDANPCSRTAPCKTFAIALSKTAAGGVVSVLDPGGFGAVTITKSISIQSDPSLGGILVAGTSGVIVNAGANDEVFLNGLILEGTGSGTNGIRFLAGKSLSVTNCIIRGFKGNPGNAIQVAPSAAGKSSVFVSNCMITGNRAGVNVEPTGTAKPRVLLDDVILDMNVGGAGAIVATGGNANVQISNTIVKNNAPGLVTASNGKIVSFGNNVISNNTPNGAPTGANTLK